jgi:hypothetical protein
MASMLGSHYADVPVAQSTQVHKYQVVFTDLASSGFETSDCRILLAFIPQLALRIPAPYRMDSPLY